MLNVHGAYMYAMDEVVFLPAQTNPFVTSVRSLLPFFCPGSVGMHRVAPRDTFCVCVVFGFKMVSSCLSPRVVESGSQILAGL